MRGFFREYFLFIFYAVISMAVINLFFFAFAPASSGQEGFALSIVNEENLNESMQDEAVNQGLGDEENDFGFFEKIDEVDVLFNMTGKVLPYAVEYNWQDYVKYCKDGENPDPNDFLNPDGSENMEDEHCLAILRYRNSVTGETREEYIDLTSYVTPANYTNSETIPTFDYLSPTPAETEVKVEIVPYTLNWENIHIKRNVAYFILPKSAKLTFTGIAKDSSGNILANKRIRFIKGDKEMAMSETRSNGSFVIGVGTPIEEGGTSAENLMPLGDYQFTVSAGGREWTESYPESTWNANDGDEKTINLGTIIFK